MLAAPPQSDHKFLQASDLLADALLLPALGWQAHAPFVSLLAQTLQIEMGRRSHMTCVACVCTGMHLGDERQNAFECPAVEDIRGRHSRLFDDSHGFRRLFTSHRDQKGILSCLLQILDELLKVMNLWAELRNLSRDLFRSLHYTPATLSKESFKLQ